MKPIVKLIKEINLTFSQLILFSKLLNAIVLFLGVYLVLAFIKFYPLLALVPTLLYIIITARRDIKKKHFKQIERTTPQLNEKLRTAVDNIKTKNVFVKELQQEVIHDAKQVHVSSFLNTKETGYKMIGAIVLCFAILFMSIFNIGFDVAEFIGDAINEYQYGQGGDKNGEGEGNVRLSGEGTTEELFGDEDVAQLGSNQFDAVISPTGYEISLDEVRDPRQRNFREAFPKEIYTTHAGSFEEDIPEKHQEIVRNYFELTGE